MNSKELSDVKEKFLTGFESKETPVEKFKFCERYYNYIDKIIKEGNWDKSMTLAKLSKEKFDVLHVVVNLVNESGLKPKDLSNNWNSQAVGKVLSFVKDAKASGSVNKDTQNEIILFVDKLTDFPTKVGCWNLISEVSTISIKSFGSIFVETQRQEAQREKFLKSRESFNYRLCRDGSLHCEPIGQVYYNHQTKEHMTFDECVEQGLSVAWLGNSKHVEGKPYPEYSQGSLVMQFIDEGDEESMAIALENAEKKRKSLDNLIAKADTTSVNYDAFISVLDAYDKFLSKKKNYKPSPRPLKNPEVELKVLQDIARSVVLDEKILEEETAETTVV